MLTIYKASLILMVVLTLFYFFQGYYMGFLMFSSNILAPIIAGIAVIVSGFSLQKYWGKAGERFSMVWLFFTIGLFLWFVGEAIWMGMQLFLV